MAVLSPSPKQQFFTEEGEPLAGGFLYTYEAGTTTPIATYVDEEGVTQNPVIIELDARGECDLWLAPGVAYKYALHDPLDALIYTVDDIIANGTLAQQNADDVAITGGTIGSGVTFNGNTNGTATNVTGVVDVPNGGTGGTTPAEARIGIEAAESGDNTDITSLDATTTVSGETIGYRGIPLNSQTSAYQVVAADKGKCITISTGGVTIPSNAALALDLGFVFSVYNNSGSSQNIAITTDTMYLAGTATTGTRALAQRGYATFVKVNSTVWVALGGGLT